MLDRMTMIIIAAITVLFGCVLVFVYFSESPTPDTSFTTQRIFDQGTVSTTPNVAADDPLRAAESEQILDTEAVTSADQPESPGFPERVWSTVSGLFESDADPGGDLGDETTSQPFLDRLITTVGGWFGVGSTSDDQAEQSPEPALESASDVASPERPVEPQPAPTQRGIAETVPQSMEIETPETEEMETAQPAEQTRPLIQPSAEGRVTASETPVFAAPSIEPVADPAEQPSDAAAEASNRVTGVPDPRPPSRFSNAGENGLPELARQEEGQTANSLTPAAVGAPSNATLPDPDREAATSAATTTAEVLPPLPPLRPARIPEPSTAEDGTLDERPEASVASVVTEDRPTPAAPIEPPADDTPVLAEQPAPSPTAAPSSPPPAVRQLVENPDPVPTDRGDQPLVSFLEPGSGDDVARVLPRTLRPLRRIEDVGSREAVPIGIPTPSAAQTSNDPEENEETGSQTRDAPLVAGFEEPFRPEPQSPRPGEIIPFPSGLVDPTTVTPRAESTGPRPIVQAPAPSSDSVRTLPDEGLDGQTPLFPESRRGDVLPNGLLVEPEVGSAALDAGDSFTEPTPRPLGVLPGTGVTPRAPTDTGQRVAAFTAPSTTASDRSTPDATSNGAASETTPTRPQPEPIAPNPASEMVVDNGAATSPSTEALSIVMPMECSYGEDCFIQNYFDLDSSPARADYTCGRLSYDGHDGTDFRLLSFEDLADDVPVLAAAAGVVARIRNDVPDWRPDQVVNGIPDTGGLDAGNGVVITHGNGWETQYSHLAEGSIDVIPGQAVAQGERIGSVGLTGLTQFPHVHFTVRRDGIEIDPFTPTAANDNCGIGSATLWEDPASLPYVRTAILTAGIADGRPEELSVRTGAYPRLGPGARLSRSAAAIVVWMTAMGMEAGDEVDYEIIDPSGETLFSNRSVVENNAVSYFQFAGRRVSPEEFPEGIHTVRLSILRGSETVDATTSYFEVVPGS